MTLTDLDVWLKLFNHRLRSVLLDAMLLLGKPIIGLVLCMHSTDVLGWQWGNSAGRILE